MKKILLISVSIFLLFVSGFKLIENNQILINNQKLARSSLPKMAKKETVPMINKTSENMKFIEKNILKKSKEFTTEVWTEPYLLDTELIKTEKKYEIEVDLNKFDLKIDDLKNGSFEFTIENVWTNIGYLDGKLIARNYSENVKLPFSLKKSYKLIINDVFENRILNLGNENTENEYEKNEDNQNALFNVEVTSDYIKEKNIIKIRIDQLVGVYHRIINRNHFALSKITTTIENLKVKYKNNPDAFNLRNFENNKFELSLNASKQSSNNLNQLIKEIDKLSVSKNNFKLFFKSNYDVKSIPVNKLEKVILNNEKLFKFDLKVIAPKDSRWRNEATFSIRVLIDYKNYELDQNKIKDSEMKEQNTDFENYHEERNEKENISENKDDKLNYGEINLEENIKYEDISNDLLNNENENNLGFLNLNEMNFDDFKVEIPSSINIEIINHALKDYLNKNNNLNLRKDRDYTIKYDYLKGNSNNFKKIIITIKGLSSKVKGEKKIALFYEYDEIAKKFKLNYTWIIIISVFAFIFIITGAILFTVYLKRKKPKKNKARCVM